MAPKFCIQICMPLCRTWAGSNFDRVHHLEENWNFKTKFRTLQLAAANGWMVARPQWQCRGIAAPYCCSAASVGQQPALCTVYHRLRGCWVWMLGSDCCRTVATSVCQSDRQSLSQVTATALTSGCRPTCALALAAVSEAYKKRHWLA